MIPPLIIETAVEKGINLIAITDHNASANTRVVQKAAYGKNVHVLPGMEIQTREEVHVLCLFDTNEQISIWQAFVDRHLPEIANDPEHFGEQFVVDETGDFLWRDERLLITSTDLSIEEVFLRVFQLGGLAIPAHVDRKAFGLFENLGIIPPGLHIEALEISRRLRLEEAIQKFPQLRGYPLIQSGDVHRLEEFLGWNTFNIQEPTVQEIRLAFKSEAGRSINVIRR